MVAPPLRASSPMVMESGSHGHPAGARERLAPRDAHAGEPALIDARWFDAAVCRNCGAALQGAFCAACGQERQGRLDWRDLRREAWEHWRLFETGPLGTLRRLITGPGLVAREYVLGRRKANLHPLKLLAFVVVALMLLVNASGYLKHFGASVAGDPVLARMAERVAAWSQWSFSTAIPAIFLASWLVFRRRGGYNATEHLVLAVYCQSLVLAAVIVSIAPAIFMESAAVVEWKTITAWAMYPIKCLVMGAGMRQFFRLHLRVDWLRLATALALYLLVSWLLLRGFSWGVLWLVRLQGP